MIRSFLKHMGRTRIIIIAILVVALLCTLTFSFWQKQKPTSEDKSAVKGSSALDQPTQTDVKKEDEAKKEEEAKIPEYKTYTTDTHPISFTHPGAWKVEKLQSNEQYALARSVTVTTDKGSKISFSIGGQATGGTCGGISPTRSTIETMPTALKTVKPTALSFTTTQRPDGSVTAAYGLTDAYTGLGETNVCDNMFYYNFDSGAQAYLLMGFHGTKTFANLDEAKTFVSSDEYAAIKKMILTLKY